MSPNRFDDLKADRRAKEQGAKEQQRTASSTWSPKAWSPQALVADGLSNRYSFVEARSNMRSVLKEFGNALWGRWRFRLTEKEIPLNKDCWYHLKGRDAPYEQFGAFIQQGRGNSIHAGIGIRRTWTLTGEDSDGNFAAKEIDELIYYPLPNPPQAEDIEAALRKVAKEGVTGKDGFQSRSWPRELE
jgi:hypothetical protein